MGSLQPRRAAARLRTAPLPLSVLLSLSTGVPPIVVPVLYPRIAVEMDSLTTSLLGLATAAYFACSSVASPFGGRLADRLGPRAAARVAATASIGVLALVAAAPNAVWLVVGLSLGGVVHGFGNTASTLVLAPVLDGGRPATQFGVRQTAVPVLSLLAGTGLSTETEISWRWLVACFLVFPLATFLLRPLARSTGSTDQPVGPGAGRVAKPMIAHVVTAALAGLCVSSLATYGVIALLHGGWSERRAGFIYASAAAISLFVRVVTGVVADRARVPALPLAAALLVVGASGFMLLGVSGQAGSLLGVLLAYGFGWSYPGLLFFSVARAFPTTIAQSAGWMQAGAAIGVSSGPAMFAVLDGRWGMGPAWIAIAVAAGGAAVVAVVGSRQEHWSIS